MFIRKEKSMKEFIRLYPAVSTLVAIYLLLWLLVFLHVPIGIQIYNWGVGQNLAVHNGEYWRLFTATFLHGGFMHVVFNAFSLVLFGPALERMIGRTKFVLVYLGAGLIGNLGSYLMEPTAMFYHLGASGAIYGLFGLYIYIALFRKQLIDHASSQIIWTFLVLGIIMTFLQPGIHIQAHVFGAIGGFALAPLVLNRVRPIYAQRVFTNTDDDVVEVQFDHAENRHKQKPDNNKILWIIIVVLAIIGLMSWL